MFTQQLLFIFVNDLTFIFTGFNINISHKQRYFIVFIQAVPEKLCKFISWGLVHVLSTDTHSPDKRPPRMAEGIQMLQKTLGAEIADRIVRNGDELFDDQELNIISPHQPKKMLGMWI